MAALLPAVPAAQDNPLGMSFIETADLRLIYFDPLGYLSPHAMRTFAMSLDWQRRLFGWTPSERTTILLKDQADYGNAAAGVAPHNRLVFDIAPQSLAFETYPASERLFSLMNHEMVHVMQGDIANDDERYWRRVFFGKVQPQSRNPESLWYSYLTVPRFTAPRWYIEGAAVFMETWMGGGLGRAQGGFDEMVFRAMVRDGAHFYDPLGLVSRGTRVDFQIGANAYLYGTRFFTYLGHRYAPQQVVDWLRRDAGSERYYAARFEQVFGLPLAQAWQEWIAFEREFQQRNLAAVRRFPITPLQPIAAPAVGSISRMYFDEAGATIYAAFRTPGIVEHVGALNVRDGSHRQLADIKRAMLYRVASFAFDPRSSTAFYTSDNLAWRDLMAVDVRSGESRMLIEDARIGEIVFNPADRSLLGVRHMDGLASLVRIPYPYDLWYPVHSFPYGVVPSDLDISADGRLLSATVGQVNGEQFLRVWPLEQVLRGELKPLSEFSFGQSVPESFVFSADGRFLYGSSYFTGVSNIFRYEVATGAVEAVSNAESGLFRPVPLADGRLLVLNYTSSGFVPAIIEPRVLKDVSAIQFLGAELVARHPVVTTWQVPPAGEADEARPITRQGPWRPLHELSLANAYPVLQGYKGAVGAGYQINVEDPLGFAKLGLTMAYTPDSSLPSDERAHVELTGEYLGWRASAAWNRSDFYDLFGPTLRSRKGLALKLGYDDLLIWDEPRRMEARYGVAYYDKIDTLPNAQNVATNFTRLLTATAGLHFTDVRRSLGAVDDEKGHAWSVVAKASQTENEVTPQLLASLDLGMALPMAHSSLWLRGAVGVTNGDRNSTLANFYFGGFGNNYVDSGSIRRYRDPGSFPGYAIDGISGQNFVRQLVEWNLPPWVFESAGRPSLHLTWLRPALFATGLWTEPANATRRQAYANVGTQVDLRFSVLHWYDMTLSAGYAVAYQGTRRAGGEWMISLKIM